MCQKLFVAQVLSKLICFIKALTSVSRIGRKTILHGFVCICLNEKIVWLAFVIYFVVKFHESEYTFSNER